VLNEFTRDLRDAGHTPDVLDLYAMKFDPVFTLADLATWLHQDMPTSWSGGTHARRSLTAPNPLNGMDHYRL
jgi:putative NADPH-quinone reductase